MMTTTLLRAPGLPPRVAPREREYGSQFGPSGAQTRVNASTFQLFKSCPRKYYLGVLAGFAKDPSDPALRFGTLMHEAKALYELNRSRGASHDLALQGAFRWLLRETWDDRLGKPSFTTDPVRNRATLLRTFVWYVDQYGRDQSDPCETVVLPSGQPAVELRFEFDSGACGPDGPVTFVGTIDRLVRFNGETYVSDVKTSTSYRWLNAANYSPDGQFSLYPLAAYVCFDVPVRGVMLDGIELTTNGAKFHREVVPRTLASLEEWLADQRVWLQRLSEAFASGEWPQNDAACGMYGGCGFRPTCAADPADRQTKLALTKPEEA